MWPYLGEFKTYPFIYGLSMVVFLCLALRSCKREQFRKRVGVALGICYIFGMTLGAKILCDLLHQRFEWHNFVDREYLFAGGFWGGPLAYLMVATLAIILFAKQKTRLLDIMVRVLVLPMILAKVTCLANGCCYGAPTSAAWAITLAEGAKGPAGVPCHPTQLYEILTLLVIQLVFAVLDRERWRGWLVVWFVAIYGIGRPVSEFFRPAETSEPFFGELTSSQTVCAAAALICLVSLLVISMRNRTRLAESGVYSAQASPLLERYSTQAKQQSMGTDR